MVDLKAIREKNLKERETKITIEPKPKPKEKPKSFKTVWIEQPPITDKTFVKAKRETDVEWDIKRTAEKKARPQRSHHVAKPFTRKRGRPRKPLQAVAERFPKRNDLKAKIRSANMFRAYVLQRQFIFAHPNISEAEFEKRMIARQAKGGGARGLAMYITKWISPIMKDMGIRPMPREELAIFIPKMFKVKNTISYATGVAAPDELEEEDIEAIETEISYKVYSYDDIYRFFYDYIFLR
jgi:hypothetical protein